MDSFHQKLKFLYIGFIVVIGIFTMVIGFFLLQPDFSKLENTKENINLNNIDKNNTINYLDVDDVIFSKDESDCDLVEPNFINFCKLRLNECNSDECFYNKGISFMNESYCNKIKDNKLNESCQVQVLDSKSFQLALSNKDSKYCYSSSSESILNSCLDNFYLNMYLQTKNSSYCSNIKNEEIKNECK